MRVQDALRLTFGGAAALLAWAFWPNLGPAVLCLTVPAGVWLVEWLGDHSSPGRPGL